MTAVINDKEISFFVMLLKELACRASEVDLRCGRGDEPYFCVESVELVEDVMEIVYLVFDFELVFFPSDQTSVDRMISGSASVGECLVGCLRGVSLSLHMDLCAPGNSSGGTS